MKFANLAQTLRSQPFKDILKELYGENPTTLTQQEQRYSSLLKDFSSTFGYELPNGTKIVSSPGRIEGLGNHTDHQQGKVIGAATNLDTIGMAVPTHDNKIRIVSKEFPKEIFEVDLTDLEAKDSDSKTVLQIKGIAKFLIDKGFELSGFDAAITSDVKVGSGLSSSASLGMLIGQVFSSIQKEGGGDDIPLLDMALAAQYAENVYWNKGSGLLDQFACATGGAAYMDFSTMPPKVEPLPLDLRKFGYTAVIIDTHTSHADGSDEYSQVPNEMKEVARQLLDIDVLSKSHKGALFARYMRSPGECLSDRAFLRAAHYYGEIGRVERGAEALRTDDFEDFLTCINDSGASSLLFLQNGYDIKDPTVQGVPLTLLLVSGYMEENAPGRNYGARLHGGGFGGTVIVYIPQDIASDFVACFNEYLSKKHGEPGPYAQELTVRPTGLVDISERLNPSHQYVPAFTTAPLFDPEVYTIRNAQGIEIQTTNAGASIMHLAVPDREGALGNIVLGYENQRMYLDNPFYLGCTVGRCANRIKDGVFTIDGREYYLAKNNGDNALHGGAHGFHRVLWECVEHGNNSVKYRLQSPDGDEGYPGNLVATVSMSLTDDNMLTIHYTASTDAPTIVNLTNHTYFNLGGPGEWQGAPRTIHGHELQVFAHSYTPIGKDLIPLGTIDPVSGTFLDLRTNTALGPLLDKFGGLDHNFMLDRSQGGLSRAAILYDPVSGRKVSVSTTKPALQVYTGNFLDGSAIGPEGAFHKHGGICLETQCPPDAENQDAFPSTILRPGELYQHTTVFEFATR